MVFQFLEDTAGFLFLLLFPGLVRFQMPRDCSPELEKVLRHFKRQALHAEKLGLIHPRTGEYCEWQQAIPDDMQELLVALRANDTLDHS